MADSPYIFEIDESNYEQIVLRGSFQVPILVDFWASWCQPCQMLMPVLAKLADEYQGKFILAKVNTEEQQAIAQQFGIRNIPNVKLFRDGQPVDEFAGALPENEIRAFLDRHLPRESDGTVAQAQQLLMGGDAQGARALPEQAREQDPANPRLALMLAQTCAAAGDVDGAEQVLDTLPADEQDNPETKMLRGQLFFERIAQQGTPGADPAARVEQSPDDSDARYRLAAQQIVTNDIAGALDNLLLVMQKDRKYGDDAARLALLKVFDMLGDDPAVNRYRARMFALLH